MVVRYQGIVFGVLTFLLLAIALQFFGVSSYRSPSGGTRCFCEHHIDVSFFVLFSYDSIFRVLGITELELVMVGLDYGEGLISTWTKINLTVLICVKWLVSIQPSAISRQRGTGF
ncbi:hypothetical protein BJP36_39320 [Moorena producens JHB]|uniref:Uncharacterized protein n=1 Tax=Moorena producens (strain JHB) TaxID=1454205 RepID=A0A9Q9SUX7_MOOP1|nr:hypothetical protein [Moorena producens]WAN70108.1 hypothetical protein BJP36_39320 [Moorena producens JHB]